MIWKKEDNVGPRFRILFLDVGLRMQLGRE
jgi:hypothetical protein